MITLIDDFISEEKAQGILLHVAQRGPSSASLTEDSITSVIVGLIKEKFNSRVRTEFIVLRPTPAEGHHWHCDGGKPEGASLKEREARCSEPWKNVKWVKNKSHKRAYTSILLLSDPNSFEGGELCTYNDAEDEVTRHKEGMYLNLALFESNHTNQHMVTPITSGQRIAHIAWYQMI